MASILLVMILSLVCLISYISIKCSMEYGHEVNQRLNHQLAENIGGVINPAFQAGKINQDYLDELLERVTSVNPNIEVYLTDLEGKIVAASVSEEPIVIEKIDLKPVQEFIAEPPKGCLIGINPRHKTKCNIFSAAPLMHNDIQKGYTYVVLGGNGASGAMAHIKGSYILQVGARNMMLSMAAALLLGLLGFWFLTNKFTVILDSMRKFKEGDLDTRIELNDKGEMNEVASTFNEMADTIQRNFEELKGVERLRRELIANVSHDLRTPIASIKGFLETLILKKDELCEERKNQYTQIALNNTERLNKLVDDLFELSRLEAKERSLEIEPLSMAELVHDVANKYRLIAKDKGVSINTILSKSLPLVEADIELIDRVLQNIIDNAIKFCQQGDVINIELNQKEQSVEVRVVDTGVGIDRNDLPHIFDRYQKGNREINGQGAGLGLAIAKKIVELHDSQIQVESELEVGTAFTFELPLYKVA